MILVNGVIAEYIPVSDRGLNYGDGVWETIAVRQYQPKMLTEHLVRLQYGIDALQIKGYSASNLSNDIAKVLQESVEADFILKIIVTRGSGGRGYATLGCDRPRYILTTHAMPSYPESYEKEGIALALCKTRLSINPQFAGFKHLNRLEQVVAREELTEGFAEGVVRDTEGAIVEGTMSNLFIVRDDHSILTPELNQCGIRGIARERVLEQLKQLSIKVAIAKVSLADLDYANALFFTNSVVRLWPVQQFNKRTYQIPSIVRELQEALRKCL